MWGGRLLKFRRGQEAAIRRSWNIPGSDLSKSEYIKGVLRRWFRRLKATLQPLLDINSVMRAGGTNSETGLDVVAPLRH